MEKKQLREILINYERLLIKCPLLRVILYGHAALSVCLSVCGVFQSVLNTYLIVFPLLKYNNIII